MDVQNTLLAIESSQLPIYKKHSQTSAPGMLSRLLHHDNVTDVRVFERDKRSKSKVDPDATKIFVDTVDNRIKPS